MNITKLTERYISEHPSIKDCLKKDLVNYSALSREICDKLNIKKFDAVLIACRRYFWKVRQEKLHEEEILALLKNCKIRIRNKIIVAIIEKPRDFEIFSGLQKKIKKEKGDFNLMEGEEVVTVVTNSQYLKNIKDLFKAKIIKSTENLVQITLIFDEKIETISGVVSYIYSLLAENGINILEEMSCWTDLMIVIDEKDMASAVKVLSF